CRSSSGLGNGTNEAAARNIGNCLPAIARWLADAKRLLSSGPAVCPKTLNGVIRQQMPCQKISGFDEAPRFRRIRQWAALIKDVAQWIREELSGFVSIWRTLSAFYNIGGCRFADCQQE
ncbi:hypothetical protein ACCT09_07250, partial [Rhizobium ruizarguesonis]